MKLWLNPLHGDDTTARPDSAAHPFQSQRAIKTFLETQEGRGQAEIIHTYQPLPAVEAELSVEE